MLSYLNVRCLILFKVSKPIKNLLKSVKIDGFDQVLNSFRPVFHLFLSRKVLKLKV